MSFVNSLWRSSYQSREDNTPSSDAGRPAFEPFDDARDDYNWLEGILDSPSSGPDPELEKRIVKNIPALFTTNLPPCGLELQLAFQNVLHRLRHVYVYLASFETIAPNPSKLALQVSETIYEHIGHEELSSDKGPWRRANVFLMELRWASWFLKEAQLASRWEEMDERAKKVQRIMWGEFVVPVELKLGLCSRMTPAWAAWRDERRKDLVGEDWEKIEDEN